MSKIPSKLLPGMAMFALLAMLCGCRTLTKVHHTCPAPTKVPPAAALSEKQLANCPAELKEYFASWNNWIATVPTARRNPAVRTVLPPDAASLAFKPEYYTSSFPALLTCMARKDLAQAQRNYLEMLALCHQQQALLSELYHAVDDLQHAKQDALAALLRAGRRLQQFQAKFHARLGDPNATAAAAELAPWLALWKGRDPLAVLPSLWQVTAEPPENAPANANTGARFSALHDERPLADACPKHLKNHRYLWMHQEFPTPVVAAGRCAYLILPALPKDTQLVLNGTALACPTLGSPACIPLTTELLGDRATQRLAVRLPAAALGEAMLPVCLAAGPKM